MAPYLLDMGVIRRITESVKPEVLVDSGLILVLILCCAIICINHLCSSLYSYHNIEPPTPEVSGSPQSALLPLSALHADSHLTVRNVLCMPYYLFFDKC